MWADVLDVYRGIWPAHGKPCKLKSDVMQAICTRGPDCGMANAITIHVPAVVYLRQKRLYVKDNLRPCVSGQIHPVLCVGPKQRMEHSTQARFEALQDLFLCDLSLFLLMLGECECLAVEPIIEPLPQCLAVGQRDKAEEAKAQLARAIPVRSLSLKHVPPDDLVEIERHVRAVVAVGKAEVVQTEVVHVVVHVGRVRPARSVDEVA
jgi:hypothetical protein